MRTINILREYGLSVTRRNAGGTFQKACMPLNLRASRSFKLEASTIVHSTDAKVILRKKV